MLAAHIDEIGLVVRQVDECGLIQFDVLGSHVSMIPVGRDALVHGRTALTGGFGRKSIDLLDNGEKQQKPTFRDLDQRRRLGKEVEAIVS
ncbi:M42 family metallopeptidase [Rhizobium leguminosarum]|nr:M42 family metallopeptidase [Rhizobium leguminosarum]